MDIETLKSQVRSLLGMTKIPLEEKDFLTVKIGVSTQEQLLKLKDNLMRQVAADIYLEFLDEVDKNDELLDEDALEDLQLKLETKFTQAESSVLTEAELSQVREHLTELTGQESVNTGLPPTQPPTSPVNTPLEVETPSPTIVPPPPVATSTVPPPAVSEVPQESTEPSITNPSPTTTPV